MNVVKWPRGSWGALILVPVLLTGCAGRHIGPQNGQHRGQVLLFRGLCDVFSLGLDDLGEKAAEAGFEVEVARSGDWRSATTETSRARAASPEGPLIVGGHSYGADNAIRYCQLLEAEGREVDLLILLDATTPPPIPANVGRCVHYYRPSLLGDILPFLLAGQPVDAAEGNTRTQLVNLRLTPERLGREADGVGHFNIDASGFIHDLCLREMNRVYLEKRRDVLVSPRQAREGGGG